MQTGKNNSDIVAGNPAEGAKSLPSSAPTDKRVSGNIAIADKEKVPNDTNPLMQNVTELNGEKIITGPLDYLLSQSGKNIRSKLISGFNQWLNVPQEKVLVITHVVELLHTASLLIDDIQDSSELRRGSPVAHKIFGVPQTINSANYAYFVAQEQVGKLENPSAFKIFNEELLKLHLGQGMDLHWRDTLTCPSEEEYLEMVSNKTGGLFRLAIRLMQLESKHRSKDYVTLANLLGVAFQIRDDYKNLQDDCYGEKKGFCEDLTEGKFSFPIIHSIRANPENQELLNILRQRTQDHAIKKVAKRYMENTGSLKYCIQRLSRVMSSARSLVNGFTEDKGKSPGIEAILDYLEF